FRSWHPDQPVRVAPGLERFAGRRFPDLRHLSAAVLPWRALCALLLRLHPADPGDRAVLPRPQPAAGRRRPWPRGIRPRERLRPAIRLRPAPDVRPAAGLRAAARLRAAPGFRPAPGLRSATRVRPAAAGIRPA